MKFNKGYENHSKLEGGGDVIHARRNKWVAILYISLIDILYFMIN